MTVIGVIAALIVAVAAAAAGYFIGYNNRKKTAEAVKQSASVMLSLLLSVLAVCVPAIAYPILLSFEIEISTEIFLACTAFYFILISLPVWFWIKNKGTKVFANL